MIPIAIGYFPDFPAFRIQREIGKLFSNFEYRFNLSILPR